MGFFSFLRPRDINEGLKRFHSTPGAMLLDVRTRGEYDEWHIPGSFSLPLNELQKATSLIPSSSTPLFVYCLSGARSAIAAARLRKMGYARVTDMGGIRNWKGEIETGGTRE